MKLIKYQLMTEVDYGTKDRPDIVQIFHPVEIRCSQDKLGANLAIAKSEAYNGEVTVEDVPDEVTAPTEADQLRADVDYLLMLQEG